MKLISKLPDETYTIEISRKDLIAINKVLVLYNNFSLYYEMLTSIFFLQDIINFKGKEIIKEDLTAFRDYVYSEIRTPLQIILDENKEEAS